MSGTPDDVPRPPGSLTALVPYAHVADVKASLAFYALLGLRVRSTHEDPSGRTVWALASHGPAQIMLAQAGGPIAPDQQAVLFYAYSDNVHTLRARLLEQGIADGGPFQGQPGPNNGRRVAFTITRPFYMPQGELRLHDPDGYVVLVGEVGAYAGRTSSKPPLASPQRGDRL